MYHIEIIALSFLSHMVVKINCKGHRKILKDFGNNTDEETKRADYSSAARALVSVKWGSWIESPRRGWSSNSVVCRRVVQKKRQAGFEKLSENGYLPCLRGMAISSFLNYESVNRSPRFVGSMSDLGMLTYLKMKHFTVWMHKVLCIDQWKSKLTKWGKKEHLVSQQQYMPENSIF